MRLFSHLVSKSIVPPSRSLEKVELKKIPWMFRWLGKVGRLFYILLLLGWCLFVNVVYITDRGLGSILFEKLHKMSQFTNLTSLIKLW